MKSVCAVAILVCAAVVQCTGNNYRMGGCPRVVVKKDLDFEKFVGEWNVVQRYNPMATCTKITIEKGEDDKYTVNETSRPFGLNFNFHSQYLPARRIHFLRNDTNSIFRLQKSFAHFTLSTFGVVETDYDSFAVVWGCDPVLFGSIQNVDILTRNWKPSEETLQKALDVVKAMNIDYQGLSNVDHSRCGNGESNEGEKNNAHRDTNNIVVDEP